jgi:hypothetical protein
MPEQIAAGQSLLVSSMRVNLRATTAGTDTPTASDCVVSTSNAGGTAVTLPQAAAVGSGFRLVIQNVGAAGTTTVSPSELGPDDTINGADAGFTTGLTAQWGSVVFTSDGVSNWVAVTGG